MTDQWQPHPQRRPGEGAQWQGPPPGWTPPPPGYGYGPPPQMPPASPPVPPTNIAAIIAVTSGLLGLLILPIVFAPVALIAGFVGEHLARKEGRKLGRVAVFGIVLGLFGTLLLLDRLGAL